MKHDKSTSMSIARQHIPDNASNAVAGDLFDVSGPTSLGSLPHGKIVPRVDPIYITSAQRPATYFPIGALPKTAPIPDAVLLRGNEELEKRNKARAEAAVSFKDLVTPTAQIAVPKTIPDIPAAPPSLSANNASIARTISNAEQHMLSVSSNARVRNGQASDAFLGQALVTPTGGQPHSQ